MLLGATFHHCVFDVCAKSQSHLAGALRTAPSVISERVCVGFRLRGRVSDRCQHTILVGEVGGQVGFASTHGGAWVPGAIGRDARPPLLGPVDGQLGRPDTGSWGVRPVAAVQICTCPAATGKDGLAGWEVGGNNR